MNAPHGFRKSWFDWFACPNCGYRSVFSYWTARIGSDRKSIKMLFWCRSCGRICTLKRQWLMPVLALCVVGPISFVLVYWLLVDGLMNINILWALFWIACVLVGVYAVLFLIGRFAKEYIAATHNEP